MNTKEAILADTALENPEEDRLGFAPFAKNLAGAICKVSTEECLVFALYGQWGTGKTTCLNFVLRYINEKPKNEKPIVVRFNPWWFSGREDLLKQFFKEFLTVLHKNKEYGESMKLLAEFMEIISELPEPTGLFGTAGRLSSKLLRHAAKSKEAWELREEIRKSLLKQNKRLLIVIDDIDRLALGEIRDLFRVIKAVADFPRTTYLLAFDKSIVVKALEELQGISGENYLEKIIQVPFDLPVPDKTALRKLFWEQLDVILLDTPEELFDQTYWGNVFWDGIDHFLNTIRNAIRLINAIKVTYPSVKGEVNPVDFVAMETIRIFSSDIWQLIRNNPDMFTEHSDNYSSHKTKEIQSFHNKWVKQISEENREIIKRLLIHIFPKLKGIFGNTYYGGEWESTWRKQLRICNPEIFSVYFRLAVPEGQISHNEMRIILALTTNSEIFGNKLLELSRQHRPDGSTRVSAFLERMEDYTQEDIPKENIPEILKALFNVGDVLLVPEDEGRGMFSFGNDMRIGRIMFQLLKRYEIQEERFRVLKEAFSKGQAVSMIVDEVATLGQQHGKYSAQAKPDEEVFVSVQHLEELEKIALDKIKQVVENNTLLKTPMMARILYVWQNWENSKRAKEWVSNVITTDEGLVDFVTSFLSKRFSQGMGDRVAKVQWRLDPKSLEPFLNPDEIIERCKNILKSPPDWLKDKKKIAVETFVKWYDLRAEGKNPENSWKMEE